MSNSRSGRLVVSAISALVAVGLGACGSDDSGSADGASGDDPLVIGFAGALSGSAAFADVPNRAGIEYAVDELNQSGGVDGHPVELEVKDMRSDPKVAAQVTRELLDDGAQVLIGPPFLPMSIPVSQAAAQEDVAVALPLDTDPGRLLEVSPGTLVLPAFSNNQQAAAAAEHALKQGATTAATVSSPDEEYTGVTPQYFAETFTNGGGEVVGDAQFTIGQTEFDSVARRVVDLNPDVVYTAMYVPDTPVFLKALRGAGFDGPVYGADGFDSPELTKSAGAAAANVFFTTNGYPEPGSKLEEVVDGIEQTQGEPPESAAFAGLGYDAVQLFAAAVETAGSLEPAAISAAFADVGTIDGATGKITIEAANQFPVKEVSVVAVEDGTFTLADQFVPKDVPAP